MSSSGNESFEQHFPPQASLEFAEYLRVHGEADPATVVLLPHIPPLIGGLKSGKFILKDHQASLDTPPDPSAVIDL